MFKVVPDQLRLSDGWVRCGHCADIFDASLHLLSAEALAAEAAAAAAVHAQIPNEPQDATPAVHDPEPPAPAVWRRRSLAARTVWPTEEPLPPAGDDDQEDEPFGSYTAPGGLAQPEFPPMGAEPLVLPTLTEDVPSALLLQTADSDEPQEFLYQTAFAPPAASPGGSAEAGIEAGEEDPDGTQAQARETPESVHPAERRSPSRRPLLAVERQAAAFQYSVPAPYPIPAPDSIPAPAEPATAVPAETLQAFGFVRDAERQAFWRRPTMVAASLAVCLLLVVALLLQVAVFQRDLLAAHLPGLRPTLEALCAPWRCQVSPLKRIDAMVIDGSGFNKARGELYQLSLDLRSTAGVPLAMPSLELTLTDTDDKTLLRRVLTPAELHAPQVLAARGAWSGTLPVRLKEAADAARVAGYRVLVFYP
jgi:hypothetical protein